MSVHHLVIHTDASVGQVHTELVAELTGDDHRLGHDFARQRVNLAGVDNLVVNGHDRAADEVEPVGVVGHGQTEVIVARNRRARIPSALDTQVADVQRLAAFVGQGLLEAQNHVDRTEAIGQERFRVCTEQGWAERGDV